jgi:hypothetical protein
LIFLSLYHLFSNNPTVSSLQINFGSISNDAAFLSSVAIILGAIFVVFQMRDDKKLLEATKVQASAAADQAKLSTEQLKQNNRLQEMTLVTTIYDQANTLEFQRSWFTILDTNLNSTEEYESLPEEKQLAFLQTASLFESVGLLVERGFAAPELVNEMFATNLAWDRLQFFIKAMRKTHPGEDFYYWFERLHERINRLQALQVSPNSGNPNPENEIMQTN